MRRLSITLFSLCLASALTAQVTGSNQSVRLRADNIDEVVSAMTLEEKVHLVIGCGMSMGSDTKFPGTAGRTYDIPRLGIPSAYLADGPHRLAMAAKREFEHVHTWILIMLRNSLPAPRWQLLSIRMQPIRWDVLWVWK